MVDRGKDALIIPALDLRGEWTELFTWWKRDSSRCSHHRRMEHRGEARDVWQDDWQLRNLLNSCRGAQVQFAGRPLHDASIA